MIYGKVGRLGHGKTMRAVVDGIDLCKLRGGLAGKCWLASNIRISPPAGMRFVQLPMDDRFSAALGELMALTLEERVGLVVVVDEVDEVWGAADWQTMRRSDRHRIKQSRHYGCDLILTAQYVDQIEKSLRNIMEEVELVRAFPTPTTARFERGRRPWVIRGHRFRPAAVRELGATIDKDKRLGATWHLYRRSHERLYSTHEIVTPIEVESLCPRHVREVKEERCPRCNPQAFSGGVLAELAIVAAESEVAVNPQSAPLDRSAA